MYRNSNFVNVLYIKKKKHPEKSDALSKTVFTGPNGSFPTDTKPEWSSVTPYLISQCL